MVKVSIQCSVYTVCTKAMYMYSVSGQYMVRLSLHYYKYDSLTLAILKLIWDYFVEYPLLYWSLFWQESKVKGQWTLLNFWHFGEKLFIDLFNSIYLG